MRVFNVSLEVDPALEKGLAKYVTKQLKGHIKRQAISIASGIREPLRQIVHDSIVSTPEYHSLLGGKLQGELGVTSPHQRIEAVIAEWVNNISVTVKVASEPLLTISIGFIQQEYEDVLSLIEASYDYEGGTIPWLRWLLLEGDSRIVRDYQFSPMTRGSRTGLGIMVPSARRGWKVPSEFSGTATDNFVTRAFDGVDIKIEKLVQSVITSKI
jgi:hypothetical protein